MIKSTTLDKLGFGPDIDSLESYLIDYKQASLMCDLYREEYNIEKLTETFKNIKPNSILFTGNTDLDVIDNDKYDVLHEKYPQYALDTVYGVHSEILDDFKNKIDEDGTHLVSLVNVCGINIKAIYINGMLYRIYAISEQNKYIDITTEFRNQLPKNIDALNKVDIAELRGKLTLQRDKIEQNFENKAIECAVMYRLRNNIDYESLVMVYNDIIVDNDNIFNCQWKKLELLNSLNINVADHSLIMNIHSDNLGSALLEFSKHFSSTDCKYDYYGLEVRLDNDIHCIDEGTRILYVDKDCNYKNIYSATIKDIEPIYGNEINLRVKVTDTKCNDDCIINYVDLDDIYDIELYNLYIGKNIEFFIVNGKAILNKK